MTIDLARARAETPGTGNVLHFNNAGAGLMPTPVMDAVVGHLQLEQDFGGYEAAARAGAQIARTYDAIAELLGASSEEIALVENASVGWLQAFHAMLGNMTAGDKIITVEAEYASNYISYLQAAKRHGIEISVVPSDADGAVDVDALRNMMDDRVKMIAVTHVPTNGGLVNPAAEIGKVARDAGVYYLLDACQSAGQIPLDVEEIGCDALSVTGRKYLRGPRGTGFLYVRKSRIRELEPVMLDLHAASWDGQDSYEIVPTAKRFENWEFYTAGIIGLGVAVDYALQWGMENIHARVVSLADRLRASLASLSGVTVTDIGAEKCGITTFIKDGVAPADIKSALAEKRINVSVSQVGSTRLDMEKRGLEQVVRASVHYYNDETEIEKLCEAVDAL
ncbi:MAG: aminotransferase class V-fold PLP-dependent enzyme [Rhodospirillales bacterium]|nr:aminotransferase class V-fold PLP-dependent enzyme [Rhodospirillales bacterium]MBO6785391.1 aminotransferase class V-fold PLP-dependent enzyme [Rhodospirillales bacterium]